MQKFLIVPHTERKWLQPKTTYTVFDEAKDELYSAEFKRPTRDERWSDADWILRTPRYVLQDKSGNEVLSVLKTAGVSTEFPFYEFGLESARMSLRRTGFSKFIHLLVIEGRETYQFRKGKIGSDNWYDIGIGKRVFNPFGSFNIVEGSYFPRSYSLEIEKMGDLEHLILAALIVNSWFSTDTT